MNKAILIQCTKSKRDQPAKASDLYDESTYYCKMRQYAAATGYSWFILSAKHGLLEPGEHVEPYDEFGLTEQQAETAAEDLADAGFDVVEVIGGRKYTNPLTPELEAKGIDVIEKCAGLSIGKRMSRLDTLISEEQNEAVVDR